MTATDLHEFELIRAKIKSNGLKLSYPHSTLHLTRGKQYLGCFSNTNDLYHFLCGYEWTVNNQKKVKE